jgi:hypothetical protein
MAHLRDDAANCSFPGKKEAKRLLFPALWDCMIGDRTFGACARDMTGFWFLFFRTGASLHRFWRCVAV